jgi:hypothetical protein
VSRLPRLAVVVLGVATSACGWARPAAGPPLQAVAFSCRLPVASLPTGSGGFVTFPDASFVPDRASGVSYDRRSGRWLPVAGALRSPDGKGYVESGFVKGVGTSLQVVDIATHQGRSVWQEPGVTAPLGWRPEGIYFLRQSARPGEPPFEGPALWVVDPVSGAPRLVTAQPRIGAGLPLFKAWTALAGGAVWLKTVPDSPPSVDILVRVDLPSGRPERWLTATPGTSLEVLGVDATDHPIVALVAGNGHPASVLRLSGPGQSTPLEAAGFRPAASMPVQLIADAHGLWVAADDGSIWLGNASQSFHLVAHVPVPPARDPGSDMPGITRMLIAGPCS